MLPKPKASHSNVNDRILGVPVWGRSKTLSRMYLRLIPDPQNIRLGAEAWGYISARTTAASGPAQVFNKGRTDFVVQKLFLIDHEGVKSKKTQVEARSASNLMGVETDYDGVPVLGPLARNMARRQHDERRGAALRETERKVEVEARRRFDAQILPPLQKTIEDFQKQFWLPLENLGLEPTPVALSTTKHRITSRLRVGHSGQLAAHTARPRAPSNSLASMQIHESLLNNGLHQLNLDGKTYSLHELYKVVARRIDRPADKVPDTMPDNVFVSFAPHDSIRVRCDDGRVVLTLALAKVERGKYRWTNLTVRASYQPQSSGLNVKLQRQGSIELTGRRLRTRDQVALRGVFSKLLSKSHEWEMLPQNLVTDPRLADLAVSQAKITDGWIGIAIAPEQRATPSVPATAKPELSQRRFRQSR
jgi:hypothetical protein